MHTAQRRRAHKVNVFAICALCPFKTSLFRDTICNARGSSVACAARTMYNYAQTRHQHSLNPRPRRWSRISRASSCVVWKRHPRGPSYSNRVTTHTHVECTRAYASTQHITSHMPYMYANIALPFVKFLDSTAARIEHFTHSTRRRDQLARRSTERGLAPYRARDYSVIFVCRATTTRRMSECLPCHTTAAQRWRRDEVRVRCYNIRRFLAFAAFGQRDRHTTPAVECWTAANSDARAGFI